MRNKAMLDRIALALCLAFVLPCSTAHPCTIASLLRDGSVIVGNNEDYYHSDDYYVFIEPADTGGYGYILFGSQPFLGRRTVEGA